jgi:hypothetical protein
VDVKFTKFIFVVSNMQSHMFGVRMKTDGKNLVSVRPYFYIYSIFAAKWKWDGKLRKWDGKWTEGNRERNGIREKV